MTAPDIVRIPAPVPEKVPTIRRKIPAPFQRPSITIGGPAGPKRHWRHNLACNISPGDTVPGIGIVTDVVETVDPDTHAWTVVITGGDDNTKIYAGTDTVWVFCVAEPRE